MMIVKNAFRIGADFFKSKEFRISAIALLSASIVFELLVVYLNVRLAQWSNDFYTSLENLDKQALSNNLKTLALLIVVFVTVVCSKYVVQSYLYIKWRCYLTDKFIAKWTNLKSFYGFHLIGNSNDNPDQRISEDLKSFVNLSIDLTLGLLRNIVTLVSFIAMLWVLSGVLKFELFGYSFSIAGYLVYVALIYSAIDTVVTYKIGRNLAKKDYLQEKREADFRFSLVRFRENAESIAMYGGEKFETKILKKSFAEVVNNFIEIVKINRNINIWFVFSINISSIVPILFAAPRLFAKEINFGGLIQIRMAFNQVQDAFSFFASSITTIAAYKAVVERITEFEENIAKWEEKLSASQIKISTHLGDSLKVEALCLNSPTNKELQNNLNFTFKPGNTYLINGRNGSGKSTFLKAIQGMWPFGKGQINIPDAKHIFFIPQHEYMPMGTLVDIISYPLDEPFDKDVLIELLKLVNLEHLSSRLDNVENWSVSLSLGEQQKISILRAIISKPDVLLMDECSNGITPKDEAMLFNLLKEKLPNAIVINIAHQESLKELHDEEIVFY